MKPLTEVLAESGKVGMVISLGVTALYNIGCPQDVIYAYAAELAELSEQGIKCPERVMIVEPQDIAELANEGELDYKQEEDPNLPETKPEAGL